LKEEIETITEPNHRDGQDLGEGGREGRREGSQRLESPSMTL